MARMLAFDVARFEAACAQLETAAVMALMTISVMTLGGVRIRRNRIPRVLRIAEAEWSQIEPSLEGWLKRDSDGAIVAVAAEERFVHHPDPVASLRPVDARTRAGLIALDSPFFPVPPLAEPTEAERSAVLATTARRGLDLLTSLGHLEAPAREALRDLHRRHGLAPLADAIEHGWRIRHELHEGLRWLATEVERRDARAAERSRAP